MTRADAIAQIQSTLPALSGEQVQALAEIAASWVRDVPEEDEQTRAAIAEGIAQAERGQFASAADVDALLNQPWR